MEAREAVQKALAYTKELFGEEKITNLGLEEVDYDADRRAWLITVGFSRPWDYLSRASGALTTTMLRLAPDIYEDQPVREYKVVEIDEAGDSLWTVKDRLLPESAAQ